MVALPLLLFVGLRVEALGERAERFIPGRRRGCGAARRGDGRRRRRLGARRARGRPRSRRAGRRALVVALFAWPSAASCAAPRSAPPLARRLVAVGLSLTALFALALAHLTTGLTDDAGAAQAYLFDLPGVPASIFFLWVVHRVHANSLGRLEPAAARGSRDRDEPALAVGGHRARAPVAVTSTRPCRRSRAPPPWRPGSCRARSRSPAARASRRGARGRAGATPSCAAAASRG